jgi:hypothetical protein
VTWHIPENSLWRYVAGQLAEVDSWSAELHLERCRPCRDRLATAMAATPLAAVLDAVRADVTAHLPRQGAVRRGDKYRRAIILLAAGPGLRGAWSLAMAAVLLTAATLDVVSRLNGGLTGALLILAPVLPLTGVALSYGPRTDPAFQALAATPLGGFPLLLWRTTAVLAVSIPLATLAGVATGTARPGTWLLPAFALTAGTLALGSRVGPARAAAVLGTSWLVAATWSLRVPEAAGLFADSLQPAWFAVAVVCTGVVVLRRRAFALLPTPWETS